ncbi:MAG: hypothetical protein GF332_04820 [Candidatus Moranbacteria bacterium]|nr:hypothetical protein [Candidatus Moranbacteria bacterium]
MQNNNPPPPPNQPAGSTPAQGPVANEQERIEKIFLEELESLRRQADELVNKYKVSIAKDIFISNWDERFSFESNLKAYMDALAKAEQDVFAAQGDYDQHEKNQCLSQLRILREKGKTAFDQAQEQLKMLEQQ